VAAVQPLLATAQASRRGEDLLTRLRASA
jgi:hypothetical protein